ncbi:hypothetical protein V1478_013961 [Vespula squamosa]|uniref:Uncharacterized protein n=1 Tax=Vespula squamosa TaxID=30214 RepID=A0ABD2A980_VESSQ
MVERRETSRVRHFKGGFSKGHEILIASSYRQTQTRCRNSSYSGRQLCTVPCVWLARCSRHYAIYHKDKSSNVERECHAYPDSRCSSLRSCLSRMNGETFRERVLPAVKHDATSTTTKTRGDDFFHRSMLPFHQKIRILLVITLKRRLPWNCVDSHTFTDMYIHIYILSSHFVILYPLADVGDYVDDKSKEAGKPTEFPASSRPTMTLLGNLGKCGHVRHNHPDVSRHMVCARLSWGNRTTFHHRTSLCS